ncbi:MAG TPA: hypothetical protein VML75_02855 [Kofleriaceae bacterium]|nr:hypothetical protein [Kofleriaceae bacterium]
MGRYLAHRLLQIVPMLLGVGTLVFFLIHATPGGPVVALGGEFVTAEYQAAIERLYGLDRPLIEQYGRFLGLLLQGELGQSYRFKAPVLDIILTHLRQWLRLSSCWQTANWRRGGALALHAGRSVAEEGADSRR